MRRDSLLEICSALNQSGSRYLVMGGHALLAHGVVRYTRDLDLLLDLAQPLMLRRCCRILERLGLQPTLEIPCEGIADIRTRRLWREERGIDALRLVRDGPLGRDEVTLWLEEPFPFAAAYAAADWRELPGGVHVPFVDRHRLLGLKRAGDRPRDRDDAQALLEGNGRDR